MMIRTLIAGASMLAPSALLAHDAGGLPHAHPHGLETAVAAVGVAVALALVIGYLRAR